MGDSVQRGKEDSHNVCLLVCLCVAWLPMYAIMFVYCLFVFCVYFVISVRMSVYLSLSPIGCSVCLLNCLSVLLFGVCLSLSVCVCLSVSEGAILSVISYLCCFLCQCVLLSICVHVRLSACLSFSRLSVSVPVCLTVYGSNCHIKA